MPFKRIPESSVRRLVECPICFEAFTNPKELECQHTFCEKPCLDKLVNSSSNTLKCPLCRAVHNIPKGGIRELKTNKTIADLVELTATSNTAVDAKTECEVCFSKDYIDGCLHCSKMVCADCKTRHTEHMLLDVQQLASSVTQATKSSLVQVETEKSDLKNDVTTFKSNVEHSIDELMRRIQQKGRDIEHELDHHLATELSKVSMVNDKRLKLNTVIRKCREIRQTMASDMSQTTMEIQRRLLVEKHKAASATFSIPCASKIEAQLTPESVFDSIKQFGIILKVNYAHSSQPTGDISHQPTGDISRQPTGDISRQPTGDISRQPTGDISHQPAMEMASDMDDETLPSSTIQGTTSAMEIASATSNMDDETIPRDTSQGTTSVMEMNSAASKMDEVTHPRNATLGTTPANEMASVLSEIEEVTHPKNATLGTTPANEMASVLSEIEEVTHPRNAVLGTTQVMEMTSVSSSGMDEVTHPCDPSRSTVTAMQITSCDSESNRDSNRLRRTVRGTTNDQFRYITSVAISPVTGDIAVCDMGRHVIAVFTESGKFKTEFGGLGTRPGLFNTPRGVTYNKSGHIIVADSLNNRIQIFDDVYHLIKAFSQKGGRGYDVNDPRDVAASESNIWVCDHGNNRIRIFTRDGKTSPSNNITLQSFTNPTRIMLDHLYGGIYILDTFGLHYFELIDQADTEFRNSTANIKEHRGMTKDSAIAFNEDGALVYSNKSNMIFVYDEIGACVNSFMSLEADATNTTVKALAIRKGRIVVAGNKFMEIY